MIKLVPKTYTGHMTVKEHGDLYRVIREDKNYYYIESINFKLSKKGLKLYYETKIPKFDNYHFDIIQQEDK